MGFGGLDGLGSQMAMRNAMADRWHDVRFESGFHGYAESLCGVLRVGNKSVVRVCESAMPARF